VSLQIGGMQDVLSHFGAEMSNIVDETFLVTDMNELFGDIEDVYGARKAAYECIAHL
jgi:hemoglobin-like flavoprotein